MNAAIDAANRLADRVDASVDAKRLGQEQSLLDLLMDPREAFFDTIQARPVGSLFSINDIRKTLDAHSVPDKSRAGLFSAACSAGLIEPYEVFIDGRKVAVSVDSTGPSAHRAKVRVYRRL